MNNLEVYVSGFFVIIGGIIFSQALSLPYYGQYGPGPGLLPLWVGLAMAVLSLINLIQAYRRGNTKITELLPQGKALINLLACIGGYVLFMVIVDYVGFTISSILMLTFIFSRGYKLQRAIGLSIVVTVVLFIVFGTILGIPLPVNEFGW